MGDGRLRRPHRLQPLGADADRQVGLGHQLLCAGDGFVRDSRIVVDLNGWYRDVLLVSRRRALSARTHYCNQNRYPEAVRPLIDAINAKRANTGTWRPSSDKFPKRGDRRKLDGNEGISICSYRAFVQIPEV
jgi:hypothetical protein